VAAARWWRRPAGGGGPLVAAARWWRRPAGGGGPLVAEAKGVYGLDLEIVAKPQGQRGFSVLPRRWVVERAFSWLGKCRLSKDYEQQPCMERAFIHVAMTGLMLRRLAR
jgi:putative transposase